MARQVATAVVMLGALFGFAGGARPQTRTAPAAPPAAAPSTLAPVVRRPQP